MSGRCYPDTDNIKHFVVDDEHRELDGEHRFVEVRYDRSPEGMAFDGSDDQRPVDEICTTQIHLEQMDVDSTWMDVAGLHVWFRAVRVKGDRRSHLVVTCYPSSCTPYVVRPGEGTLEWIGQKLDALDLIRRALDEDLEPKEATA